MEGGNGVREANGITQFANGEPKRREAFLTKWRSRKPYRVADEVRNRISRKFRKVGSSGNYVPNGFEQDSPFTDLTD